MPENEGQELEHLVARGSEETNNSWRIEVEWSDSSDGFEAPLVVSRPNIHGGIWGATRGVEISPTASLLVGTLCTSTAGLCAKLLIQRFPLFQIITLQSSVSLPIFLGLCKLHNGRPNLVPRNGRLLFGLACLAGSSALICRVASLLLVPLLDSTAIFLTHSLFSCILGWLLGSELPNFFTWFGSMVCVFGLLLVLRLPLMPGAASDWGRARLLGVGCSLLSAFFVGVGLMAARKMSEKPAPLTMIMWVNACACALSTIPMLAGAPLAMNWTLTFSDGVLLAALGLTSLLGQVAILYGFAGTDALKAHGLLATEALFACVFGFTCLDESVSREGVLGAIFMAFAATVIAKGSEVGRVLYDSLEEEEARWTWDAMAAVRRWRQRQREAAAFRPSEQFARIFG